MNWLKSFAIIFLLVLFPTHSFSSPSVEKRLSSFIKEFYGNEVIIVKFLTPSFTTDEKMRLVDIRFAKIPDTDGSGVLSLEWQNAKGFKKRTFVSFKVFRNGKLFVVKKDIHNGDIIAEKDLEIKEIVMERWDERYPSDVKEIIGKRITKGLPRGSVITRQILEEPVTVTYGELVTIVYEDNRLIIQTKGKALEKGKMGDVVKVENITSGKKIVGRVIGAKKVKVEL